MFRDFCIGHRSDHNIDELLLLSRMTGLLCALKGDPGPDQSHIIVILNRFKMNEGNCRVLDHVHQGCGQPLL